MINLLKDNSKYWYIENDTLYFETDNLVNKYNTLYNELKEIANTRFNKYKENNEENKL